MNNLEWAAENEPWLFDGFACGQCTRDKGGKCVEVTDCAKGHAEWLMQPRESSLEAVQTGDCEKDEREPAESENAAPMYVDNREKLLTDLETHVRKWREHDGNFMRVYSTVAYAQVKKLLDRQAAITEMESDAFWADRVRELEDEVTSLESERDHWRETAGRLSDEIPLDEKLIEQRDSWMECAKQAWRHQAAAEETIRARDAAIARLKEELEGRDSFACVIADASAATGFDGSIGFEKFRELVERCERLAGRS